MIPTYAYVLRLWSENQANGQVAWRVALLDPQSGQRLGFPSLAAMMEYLEDLTATGDVDVRNLSNQLIER